MWLWWWIKHGLRPSATLGTLTPTDSAVYALSPVDSAVPSLILSVSDAALWRLTTEETA